jgi:cytochrome b subunit of formate dehydrogenase
MVDKILTEKNLVSRHSMLELAEHWLIAISGLILFFTGMFELPMSNRYYISSVPGLAWSADFITSLYIHYFAAIIFIAAGLFHLGYHGIRGENGMIPQKGDMAASVTIIKSLFGFGKEPPMSKYLPEQRLAYVGMAFIMAMLIISGLVKTYKNIYAPDMSLTIVLWATWVHNIFFILFFLAFLAHMAAIALRPNWPMVRGIFTGKVRLDYARHRHSLWLADIEKVEAVPVVPEIVLPVIDAEPLPELQKPPQEELLTPIAGEPAKINDETTKQEISKD